MQVVSRGRGRWTQTEKKEVLVTCVVFGCVSFLYSSVGGQGTVILWSCCGLAKFVFGCCSNEVDGVVCAGGRGVAGS